MAQDPDVEYQKLHASLARINHALNVAVEGATRAKGNRMRNWPRLDDWAQAAEVLSALNRRINWALDAGADNVFRQVAKYRAELLTELHQLAQQELALIDTAEDFA